MSKKEKQVAGTCEYCAYLIYDEEYEEYVCDVNMDEDDYGRMMTGQTRGCPYFKDGDEYKVVRHQM